MIYVLDSPELFLKTEMSPPSPIRLCPLCVLKNDGVHGFHLEIMMPVGKSDRR
jgi:hypothetical protein